MKNKMIKPRILQWKKIHEIAEDFRKRYVDPPHLVPIPIEEITEFKLRIEIWPLKNLKSKSDIEAFLSNNLKVISIDADLYNDDRYLNRVRYSLAHEVGHIFLHGDEIRSCEFNNVEEWIAFRDEMDEDDLFWFEQQAYEFAGRLLVPKFRLEKELKLLNKKIEKFKTLAGDNHNDMIIQAISRSICDVFGVSEQVIKKRIKNEKLWDDLAI
jgi:Zn-dependent peptidase ImmA (M78 family)